MTSYVCVICDSVNHSTRVHCRACGTIPAMYAMTGKPSNDDEVEVVVARGAWRVTIAHASHIHFRTVPADYYSEAARWNNEPKEPVAIAPENNSGRLP